MPGSLVIILMFLERQISHCIETFLSKRERERVRGRETERGEIIGITFTLCYANGYCSVSFTRKFHGFCFFSAVTADVGLNAYVEKDVTCSSIHGNVKSGNQRSLVNISSDPQGVSRSIKLFVHLYTERDHHLLERGRRLSTFHMQQGKTLQQGGLPIGMHKLY